MSNVYEEWRDTLVDELVYGTVRRVAAFEQESAEIVLALAEGLLLDAANRLAQKRIRLVLQEPPVPWETPVGDDRKPSSAE